MESTGLPVIEFTIRCRNKLIKSIGLLDTGASASIIDSNFVNNFSLETTESSPIQFSGFNAEGALSTSSCIIDILDSNDKIFVKKTSFHVLQNLNFPVLIGSDCIPWNTTISFGLFEIMVETESGSAFAFKRRNQKLCIINSIVVPGVNTVKYRNHGTALQACTQLPTGSGYRSTFQVSSGKKYQQCSVVHSKPSFSDSETLVCSLNSRIICNAVDKSVKCPHYRRSIVSLDSLDLKQIQIGNFSSDSRIAKSVKNKLINVIKKYHHIWSRNDDDIGLYNGPLVYSISLQNPITESYRAPPLSYEDKAFLKAEVEKLLKNDIVEPATSSRIMCGFVIVVKKNGKKRLCLDSRIVNRESFVTHNMPIAKIDDILSEVANYKFYATIDLNSAYWQILLPEKDRDLYTFLCDGIVYRFKRSSFGTKNMTSFFTSVISDCFQGINNVRHYVDDIIVFDDTSEGLIATLQKIFDRLSQYNLTAGLSKSEFLKRRIVAFGFEIDESGFRPIPSKIEKLMKIPFPDTTRKLQQALGAFNFYRCSCPKYKEYAAHFYDCVNNFNPSEPIHKEKWKKLLETFSHTIDRNRPDFSCNVILKTDSCETGASLVLSQNIRGRERILTVDGTRYRGLVSLAKMSQKELYGVYVALKKYEKLIRIFPKVLIMNDNVTVCRLLNKLDEVQVQRISAPVRWCLFISSFKYEVFHVKGSDNSFGLTDMISRIEYKKLLPCTFGDLRSQEVLVPVQKTSDQQINSIQKLSDVARGFKLEKIQAMVKSWQKKSPIPVKKSYIVKSEENIDIIFDKNGYLLVPTNHIHALLVLLHTHQSVRDMINLISDLGLTFPAKYRVVREFVESCATCVSLYAKRKKEQIRTSIDWASDVGEVAAIDVVHITHESATSLFLGLIDHWSGFIQIELISNLKQDTIVKGSISLLTRTFCPMVLVADNATYFGKRFEELLETLNIRLSHSTARNSRGNAKIERAFRSLQAKLKTILQVQNIEVEVAMDIACFVLNNQEKSNGYTPYQMLSLRRNSYPINQPNFTTSRFASFDTNIKAIIEAGKVMLQEINAKRRRQEVEPRKHNIQKGDLVVIRDYSTGSKPSIKPFYKTEVFEVLKSNRFTGQLEVSLLQDDPRIRRKTILVHERNVKRLKQKKEENTEVDTDTSTEVETSEDEAVIVTEKEKDISIDSEDANSQSFERNVDETNDEDIARSNYRKKLRKKSKVTYF